MDGRRDVQAVQRGGMHLFSRINYDNGHDQGRESEAKKGILPHIHPYLNFKIMDPFCTHFSILS